jgi:hypothetical protein
MEVEGIGLELQRQGQKDREDEAVIKDKGVNLVSTLVVLQSAKEASTLIVHLSRNTRAPRLMAPL